MTRMWAISSSGKKYEKSFNSICLFVQSEKFEANNQNMMLMSIQLKLTSTEIKQNNPTIIAEIPKNRKVESGIVVILADKFLIFPGK